MSWLVALLACTIEPHVPTPPVRDSDDPPPTASDPPVEDTSSEVSDSDEPAGDDADGDGYPDGLDCDDADASVHPGATEGVADGVDQDCDGTELCYRDSDDDGFGTLPTESTELSCAIPGVSGLPGDCDDFDPSIHPQATEIPGDGVDQDCDGAP